MNAQITYRMAFIPDPWDVEQRKRGVKMWCLLEVTTPELGLSKTERPVACFNLDSDATRFMAHVHASGLNRALLSIDEEHADLFAAQRQRQRHNGDGKGPIR